MTEEVMCVSEKVKKMSFDEMFKTTTMFYVNEDLESSIEKEIQARTNELWIGISKINSREDLWSYIESSKEALDTITSLASISVERFKRVVSMIRKDLGYTFGTEWSLDKTRSSMIENRRIRELILDLLWDGRNQQQFMNCIPSFYLEGFGLSGDEIKKLQDKTVLRQLAKKSIEGRYSNLVGDSVLATVERRIRNACARHGLEYQSSARIPFLDRAVSFAIEDVYNPLILVDVSYNVTTSSSQGAKKEAARKTVEAIKNTGRNVVYINILDGAGWIGRQADMKEIHRCSDYVVNLKNLELLDLIIDEYARCF